MSIDGDNRIQLDELSTRTVLREDFKRMHEDLTDDEVIARNVKKNENKKRISERKEDAGIF